MISGIQTTGLSQIYKTQTNQYSKVLEQIASGQRFSRPSDDFAAYTKTRAMQSDLSSYQAMNEKLVKAKEAGTHAASFGNAVYEAVSELKDLSSKYAELGSADGDSKKQLEAEFAGKLSALNDLVDANAKEGKFSFTEDIDTYPSNSALGLKLKFDLGGDDGYNFSGLASGAKALDIDGSNIDDALEAAAKFTAQANGFNATVDRQLTINENVMAAKDNSISAVRDIDELKTVEQATLLQIRQQASVSMMVQANVAQGYLVRLFS